MTINPKTRSPPMCPKKISLATCNKRHEAATTKSCESGLWRIAQVWSQWAIQNITYNGVENFFFSKTWSFLHNQSDQQVVAATPSITKGLNTLLHPPSHVPNICHTLLGCGRPKESPKLLTKFVLQNSNKKLVPNCLIFLWQKPSTVVKW